MSILCVKQQRGYTLIEILIVVVIISITVAFAVLAFGDFGKNRRILLSAEQFANYVKLIQQQAILETKPFGLYINGNTYQAFRFTTPGNWNALPQTSIFRKRFFPDGALIILNASGQQNNNPQIIIHASGDITPFVLDVLSNKKEPIASIAGEFNGNVILKRATSP